MKGHFSLLEKILFLDGKMTEPQTKDRPRTREIEEEMKESYLNYAMSVIVGRALPDVRDGLKPVHRRILYAMFREGLLSNKRFSKCAGVVGEVLKKYHPHGDASVYDALVRLAQHWNLRYLLVEGQGNFGSVDGDPPAAYRYTESRLTKAAEELLADIDKETVDFVPNFDDSTKEPSVLPSKIPNLLVNGSSGIAVGMATSIPPHNMHEIADAIVALIDNPEIETTKLLEIIKGPDFPTGGIICGRNGILNAYSLGRGKVIVRAKHHVEQKKGKPCLIVTEIPYQVNKAEMVSQIAELVRDKKVQGITDLRDESDRDGMRVVFELRQDASPDVVINQLYQHSRLQTTFSIILLALVNNRPKVLTLREMVEYHILHQKDVVTRRTQFELRKSEERCHILEGIIIALNNVDLAVKLIRASKAVADARAALRKSFDLTEVQANAILELRLQKLASLEQESIRQEHAELVQRILELKGILADVKKIFAIIRSEILALKEQYGDERRTQISGEEVSALNYEDLVEEQDQVYTITSRGYIKRQPIDTYRQQKRGGVGIVAANTKEEDIITDIFIANTHSSILFFTDKGYVHWLKGYLIPEGSRQASGKAIVNLLQLEHGEHISAHVPVREFKEGWFLSLVTKQGTIKKTALTAYANPRKGGIIAINLNDGDKLIDVVLTDGKQQLLIATKEGMAVKFHEEDARAVGRNSIGVRGIRLKESDAVVGVIKADDSKTLLTITGNGYGKRSPISEYRLINRGGSGVINIITNERNGGVVSIMSVDGTEEIMTITKNGIAARMPVSGVSVIGRNTQGVRIMKLREDDKVVSATKIIRDDA